jgi:hypothetical protein
MVVVSVTIIGVLEAAPQPWPAVAPVIAGTVCCGKFMWKILAETAAAVNRP